MIPESTFLNPTRALEMAKLEEGMHVADFGAGSGFFTRAAARIVGPTGIVWAVDSNPSLLDRVKNLSLAELLENVEIMRGDLESPKGSHLPENQFDFVIAANVLFSAENRTALAREIKRVLKQGARALIIDWKDSFGGLGPHPSHIITIGAARDIFEKVGLSYIADVPACEYHWGFIVRKLAHEAAQ